ncbi:MAG: hypothetical protein FJ104_04420 [Deltaproteobacteria bacterium]|nr:hypothetical protein [Deltaproteobacteria bacterium]
MTAQLHMLGEGVLRSPAALGAQEFGDALADLRRAYDLIVMDAPPLGDAAAERAIGAVVDAVLVVVGPGSSLPADRERAAQVFRRAEILGPVVAGRASGPRSTTPPRR